MNTTIQSPDLSRLFVMDVVGFNLLKQQQNLGVVPEPWAQEQKRQEAENAKRLMPNELKLKTPYHVITYGDPIAVWAEVTLNKLQQVGELRSEDIFMVISDPIVVEGRTYLHVIGGNDAVGYMLVSHKVKWFEEVVDD